MLYIRNIKRVLAFVYHKAPLLTGLTCLSLVGAGFFELAALGSVLPLLSTLFDEKQTLGWSLLPSVAALSPEKHLFFSLGAVVVLFMVSNATVLASSWALGKLSWESCHEISRSLLAHLLHQPYENRGDAESIKKLHRVVEQSKQLANGILIPLFTLFSRTILAIAIVGFMIVVLPGAYLAVWGVALALSVFVHKRTRHLIQKIGATASTEYLNASRSAMNALLGLKELMILGKENEAVDDFSFHFSTMAKVGPLNLALGVAPRLFFEILGLVTILGGVILMKASGIERSVFLSNVGVSIVVSSRLMPVLTQIYSQVVQILYFSPVLEEILSVFEKNDFPKNPPTSPARRPMQFQNNVEFRNVSFAHTPGRDVLKDLNLIVPRGSIVGIEGKTGSGKSTLIDLFLGLLNPREGQVLVDGVPLRDVCHSWQGIVGYASQEAFILEGSIEDNVAFGVSREDVDHRKIQEVLAMADLSQFVGEDFISRPDSKVGEFGGKLSGGQRQRLAIARALYSSPQVLVLDEFTSALDPQTESKILATVKKVPGLTVLIISHKTAPLEICDVVYRLDHGSLHACGPHR